MLPLEKIPKEVSKAPKKKAKTASKLQRPQTVVLPPKKPPISPEMARPEETEGQSAPPATLRFRTRYPEAPPPESFHAEVDHRSTSSHPAHHCQLAKEADELMEIARQLAEQSPAEIGRSLRLSDAFRSLHSQPCRPGQNAFAASRIL